VSDEGRVAVELVANGRAHAASAEPRMLLADFLRETLGLTGTHLGCEHGVCGVCTVLLDGLPVRSCLMFAAQADGCEVQTIEGLADGAELHPLQAAFQEQHSLQCGFCTPGFLMSAAALLAEHPDPSEAQVREALDGVLCRCTGYRGMVRAVLDAAERLRATPDA
jgi:aerobic carbon-monoxide dehydrogenase small subunit